MAFTTLNDRSAGRSAQRGFFAGFAEAVAKHRAYRRTVDELAALTDAELRDVGISRQSIRRVAYEGIYGR